MGLLLGVGLGMSVEARSLVRQEPDAAAAQAGPPPKPPAILDGAKAFKERGCSQCHTIRGVGGNRAPDLSGVGRRMKREAIRAQIADGGRYMPAFGDVIEAKEIDALTAYLGKLKDKGPATAPTAQ